MKPINNKSRTEYAARMCALLIMMVLAVAQPASSQPHVNVNINIQPLWGPVGYDYVEYYYLPAYEVYYYVPRHQFVYLDGPAWHFATVLPARFGAIDYYSAYKVVINEPKPYLHYKVHKVKYAGGGPKQIVIRDSHEAKYFVVKGHPSYHVGKKEFSPSAGKGPKPVYKSGPGNAQGGGNKGAHGGGGGNKGGPGGGHGGGHGKGGKK